MTFIINRWVRGSDFLGRDDLLKSLRERGGKPTWVLGNRRVGKTSLLRQIEWLAGQGRWTSGAAAMYWDLQGSATPEGLKDSFLECLEDHQETTANLGLDVDALEAFSFAEIANKFRRKAKTLASRLILLIDECEELVDVAAREPGILSSFRKLTHGAGMGVILAGSFRFMDLDESKSPTSPFLPDFLPPLALGPFTLDQSSQLLTANGLTTEAAAKIYGLCLGNPHLLQVIGEYYQRLEDWDRVLTELKLNKVCHYYFQSNFQCLPASMAGWWPDKQAISRLSALQPGTPEFAHGAQASLVTQSPDGDVVVSPLLKMVLGEGYSEPRPVGTQKSDSRQGQPWPALMQALGKREKPLLVLPAAYFRDLDAVRVERANNPPELNLLASLDRDPRKIHEILDGASPEYVLARPGDSRTAAYLVGLALYRNWLNHAPFSEISDPWERAAAIADRDALLPSQENGRLSAKRALVLLRCLRANPNDRYDSLEKLAQDLESAENG